MCFLPAMSQPSCSAILRHSFSLSAVLSCLTHFAEAPATAARTAVDAKVPVAGNRSAEGSVLEQRLDLCSSRFLDVRKESFPETAPRVVRDPIALGSRLRSLPSGGEICLDQPWEPGQVLLHAVAIWAQGDNLVLGWLCQVPFASNTWAAHVRLKFACWVVTA